MAVDTRDKRFSMLGLAGGWIFPNADGAIDAGDRSQFLRLYRGIALSSTSWYTKDGVFEYTAANWTRAVAFYHEARMVASSGTVHARVYDNTAAAAVASSELSSAAASRTRLRSAALTLIDGHEYEGQVGAGAADAGEVTSKVIAVET